MSTKRRPSLTPVLWARILARYGELGRPLTDAELQAIVLPPLESESPATCFAVTSAFPSLSLGAMADATRRVSIAWPPAFGGSMGKTEAPLQARPARLLIADEVDGSDRFTTNNDAGNA